MKDDKVFEMLTDISVKMAKMETHMGYIVDDLAEVKSQDAIQNQLLAEHIAGVESAKELIRIESAKLTEFQKITEARLADIEFIPNLVKTFKKALLWCGAIATAILSIAKLFGLI